MIDCMDCTTAHFFGDAIASQHRLRYRIFVERQKWELSTYHGMEFDQFDTPATTYFVWRDESGEAKGVARAKPTVCPYMLKVVFQKLVTKEPLPSKSNIWEGSRIGVERELPVEVRQRILGELFCAYLEFGLRTRIQRYLILMPIYMLRKLTQVGWPTTLIGPIQKINGVAVAAASIEVSPTIFASVRRNMHIDFPILRTAEDIMEAKAA